MKDSGLSAAAGATIPVPKTKQKAKVPATAPVTNTPVVPAEIKEQSDYINSYINSPKYTDRLVKQMNTERQLQNYGSGKFTNNELFKGIPLDANPATAAAGVVSRLNTNLQRGVENTSPEDHYLGRNIGGTYDSSLKDVRFNQTLLKQYPTVPVHEYSHAALDGAIPYSPKFKSEYVDKILKKESTPGWEPEVQKPAELKARLDSLRFILKKSGIYDAGTETFTKEHLDKMRSDKTISEDFNFKQLNDQLDDKYKNNGMIWLFNNIAKNKNENSDSSNA